MVCRQVVESNFFKFSKETVILIIKLGKYQQVETQQLRPAVSQSDFLNTGLLFRWRKWREMVLLYLPAWLLVEGLPFTILVIGTWCENGLIWDTSIMREFREMEICLWAPLGELRELQEYWRLTAVFPKAPLKPFFSCPRCLSFLPCRAPAERLLILIMEGLPTLDCS